MTNSSLPPMSLRAGMKIWRKHEGDTAQGDHLTALELLRFTQAGGMDGASHERKEHLSTCGSCLQKWFDICDEQSFSEELEKGTSSDDWYSGGMLEAAAGESRSALSLKSSCGNFQLNLFPDGDKKGAGMVALEYIGSSDRTVEGKWVTVRDMNGLVLLEGIMRVGRRASISHDLDKMDLQAWSVHLRSSDTNG